MEWKDTSMIVMGTLLMGCAATSQAVVNTAPAREEALDCAARVLAWRGYDVRKVNGSSEALSAEMRLASQPGGAVREIVTTSLDNKTAPSELRVAIQAWNYAPAQHGLPNARQSVTEIPPSERGITDVELVLTSCGYAGA